MLKIINKFVLVEILNIVNMSVKLRVLSAGVLFFMGQSVYAQKAKSDTTSTKEIEEVVVVGFGQKKTVQELTGSASTMTSKSIVMS